MGVEYRVYRADCSKIVGDICTQEGAFVRIADNIPNLVYTDRTVIGGQSYSWRVTAFDADGESEPSNSLAAKIP